MDIGGEGFCALAEKALATLPEELLDDLENVVIMTEDEPEDGSGTLGVYEGTALTERDPSWLGMLPNRVILFRGSLSRICEDENDLFEEISITLTHGVGHYHGIDERRLHELGWGWADPQELPWTPERPPT